MRSIELFTGAGGAALGLSLAGFSHDALIELEAVACATIRENKARGVEAVAKWPLHEGDVAKTDCKTLVRGGAGDLDLLAGGPPCQPFSIAGKGRAHYDDRNLFPEVIRAVRELVPRAVFIENVPGLRIMRGGQYFEFILLQLRFPEIERRHGERWETHFKRLT